MPSPVRISPSILCADPLHFADQVHEALEGGADLIHMDIMDGRFVPNLSFGPFVVEALAPMIHDAGALVDVHLMIEEPERFVTRFIDAGTDVLTLHVEAARDLAGTLKAIRARGCRCGLTLRPKTPLIALQTGLPLVDQILVMSVEPGFGGQEFQPQSLARIKRLREMLDSMNSSADIEVDGGIDCHNAGDVAAAGATILVVGNSAFRSGLPVREAVRALRQAANPALAGLS